MDNPLFEVIANSITAEHHIVEIDIISTISATFVKLKAIFIIQALSEELEHFLLALAILLNLQEMC